MHIPGALVVVIGLGLGLGFATSAAADAVAEADRAAARELDAAEQALHDLRYEEAAKMLERARRSGQNGPRALARLYRLRGELAATLGDAVGARDAFAQWLALEPRAALARGTSPKITATFAAAVARLGGAALDVGFLLVDGGAAVALEVRSDPLAMVAGARAYYPGRGAVGRVEAGVARVALAVPGARREQVVIAALDVHGNRLAEQELTLERAPVTRVTPASRAAAVARVMPGSSDAPPRPAPPPRPATPPRASPLRASPAPAAATVAAPAPASRWRFHRGWALGGAAIALGAVGGTYAVRAARAQDELDDLNGASGEHSYLEAEAAADRLRTRALVANTSLVLAGGCALAAVLLWPDAPPDHPARRISWQVGRDGAAAALEWSW